jgi:hypothetical protein
MLSFALTVALAVPCGIPKLHHAHHKAEPVQTCAAPIVPMCFREPSPDPSVEPMPTVLPYYITTPVQDDESGEGAYIEQTNFSYSSIEPGAYVPFGEGTGGIVPPIGPHIPPTARAPEINGQGAAAALTLLLASIAIAKGKKK